MDREIITPKELETAINCAELAKQAQANWQETLLRTMQVSDPEEALDLIVNCYEQLPVEVRKKLASLFLQGGKKPLKFS